MKTPYSVRRRWRSPLRLVVLLGLVSCVASSTAAQSTVITGRVQSALTGQYLNNARVSAVGTTSFTFTDETGTYRLTDLPPGRVSIEVFYSGMNPATLALDAPPGVTTAPDVRLVPVGETDTAIERMSEYVVVAGKVTEGEQLAVNEQRFAPNIKSVVSADAFGNVLEGNVGEFLKYLPGVSVEDEGDAATTIQLRGFNASMTSVSIDGAQVANAVRVGASREFHFKQVSINDTSRIEVTKVPTPATRADALGGSIDLVSKSAFERKGRQFNFDLSVAGNTQDLTFSRRPHSTDKVAHKLVPGVSFDYTLPVSKNLGLILTGMISQRFHQTTADQMAFSTAANAGASFARPVLNQYSLLDGTGMRGRYSGSVKVDWRPFENTVVSASVKSTYFDQESSTNILRFNKGTNPNPTISGGVRMTYDERNVIGATGRGSVLMTQNHQNIDGQANVGTLRFRTNRATWRVDGGLNYSESKTWRRYFSKGTFKNVDASLRQPLRIEFHDIGPHGPGSIAVLDNSNREIDYLDPANYSVTGAAADSWGDVREKIASGAVNVRRSVGALPFPLALQAGWHEQVQIRDTRIIRAARDWTYQSPDGDASAARFLSRYAYYDTYAGVGRIPWVSPVRAYELWQDSPAMFYMTPAQLAAQEKDRLTNSEHIKEWTDAVYIMADLRLLKNRLWILTGVRYERTQDFGEGMLSAPDEVWLRNADGTFAHDSRGRQIRRPEAGAVGSIEEVLLTTVERGSRSNRSYDGYYPSLNATYSVSENMIARFGFARTYGRPDFDSVIPNTVITDYDDPDNDPNALDGLITIRNTGLRPWRANAYDLSLEYYTGSGGVFGAGVFLKDIKDFFGEQRFVATRQDLAGLGLDPRYEGWEVRTSLNAGDARILGGEANVRQSLQALGSIGRYFTVFANVTKLDLQGSQNANFTGFQPLTANWGVTFRRSPLMILANWNYRGKQPLQPAAGPNGYTYRAQYLATDVTATYQLTRHLSLWASARNLFNEHPRNMAYNDETPAYAKVTQRQNHGTSITLGLRGTY